MPLKLVTALPGLCVRGTSKNSKIAPIFGQESAFEGFGTIAKVHVIKIPGDQLLVKHWRTGGVLLVVLVQL